MRTRRISKQKQIFPKKDYAQPFYGKIWDFPKLGIFILLLIIRRIIYPIFVYAVYMIAHIQVPFYIDIDWFKPENAWWSARKKERFLQQIDEEIIRLSKPLCHSLAWAVFGIGTAVLIFTASMLI